MKHLKYFESWVYKIDDPEITHYFDDAVEEGYTINTDDNRPEWMTEIVVHVYNAPNVNCYREQLMPDDRFREIITEIYERLEAGGHTPSLNISFWELDNTDGRDIWAFTSDPIKDIQELQDEDKYSNFNIATFILTP